MEEKLRGHLLPLPTEAPTATRHRVVLGMCAMALFHAGASGTSVDALPSVTDSGKGPVRGFLGQGTFFCQASLLLSALGPHTAARDSWQQKDPSHPAPKSGREVLTGSREAPRWPRRAVAAPVAETVSPGRQESSCFGFRPTHPGLRWG